MFPIPLNNERKTLKVGTLKNQCSDCKLTRFIRKIHIIASATNKLKCE